MLTLQIEQGTAEWQAARCGIPTASNFDKIITAKGEPSKQREKYMYQLAGERITGVKEESYQSAAMTRGIEMEAEARSLYEIIHEVTVEQVGICYPNEDKKFSCSPDGLIGLDGGLEIKCPLMVTHIGYLINGKLVEDYFQQVQGGLYVTGRAWWDLVSYYLGIKPLIVRVERDEKFIAALDRELKQFCADLDAVEMKIR